MKKSFFIISIIVVVLALLAYVGINKRAMYQPVSLGKSVANFEQIIDKARQIQISSEENSIDIVLSDNVWTLQDTGGYPIDFDKLRDLVHTILQSEKIESRSTNANTYQDYGLGSKAKYFSFFDQDGKELLSLTIGKQMYQLDGWYALIDADPQVWVISGDLFISTAHKDWLIRDIIDIQSKDIQLVVLDDQTRIARDADMQLYVVGENHNESIDLEKLEDVLQSLDGLLLLDANINMPDISTDMQDIQFITQQGLVVDVSLVYDSQKQYWANFTVTSDEDAVIETDNTQDTLESVFAATQEQQKLLEDRLADWWLRIPTSAAKSMAFLRNDLNDLEKENTQ